MTVAVNERILRRIKGLLALAEGEANVNESHAALLQAQRMMVKYGVDASELTDDEEIIEVLTRGVSDYKRLFWYERMLANIVADNFRCKNYIESKSVAGKSQMQRRIVFMGTDKDVELAEAMYKLVVEAIKFYARKYVKENKDGTEMNTTNLRNHYMRGFVDGLREKFEEQIKEQEWCLVIKVPKEVEDAYNELTLGNRLSYRIPGQGSGTSYRRGYRDGNSIDYKKETIDG